MGLLFDLVGSNMDSVLCALLDVVGNLLCLVGGLTSLLGDGILDINSFVLCFVGKFGSFIFSIFISILNSHLGIMGLVRDLFAYLRGLVLGFLSKL